MGLLDTILSLFGLADTSADDTDDDRRDATVSVEREARTDTEAAVKGTDMEAAEDDGAAAATSTGTPVDGDSAAKAADDDGAAKAADDDGAAKAADDDGAAEPAEAAGPDDGVETELDTATAESEGETTGEHEAAVDDGGEAAADGTAESTDVIKGIGPAYADRLSDAGVDSVADLAAADADDLAEAIDLSPKRVGRWIERAQDR